MKSSQLTTSEYAAFYSNYIKKSGDLSLLEGLKESQSQMLMFFKSIPKDRLTYRYAEEKWTPKDILQHLIDAERVFVYRALRFVRNDKTELAGFEENDYASVANANSRALSSLLEEYESLRMSTIALFKSFDEDALKRVGKANGSSMSVRAIGFVLIGHETHHCEIIKERYL